MSAHISLSSWTLRLGLAAGLAIKAANASSAYLPVTGPTPLRFEVALTRTFDFSSVGKPAVTVPTPEAASTNSIAPTVSLAESNTTPATITVSTAPVAEEPPLPSVPPHPADNLVVITPQMLAEYFKPVPGGTNAAGVSIILPAPVGFTPPTEKSPATSRATYKVQ